MQRTPTGTGSTPMPSTAPLATTGNTGQYVPGPPLMPGQVLAPPPAARGMPTLAELYHALKRRLVLATFLGLLVGAGAAAAVWLALPNGKHTVRALLQVYPIAPVGRQQQLSGETQFNSFKETQEQLVRGRVLLQQVIGDAAVARLPDIRTSDDAVRDLEEAIRVKWVSSELMQLSMTGNDPPQLKTILDTLVNEYVKSAASDENKARRRTRLQIESNLADLERQIGLLQKKIQDSAERGTGADPMTRAVISKMSVDLLTAAVQKREAAQQDLKEVDAAVKALDAKLAAFDATPVGPEVVDEAIGRDPQFADAAAEVARLQKNLDVSRATLLPTSRFVADDEARLKKARDDFRRATAEARPRFEQDARARLRQSTAVERQKLADKAAGLADTIRLTTENETRLKKEVAAQNVGGVATNTAAEDIKPLKEQRTMLQNQLLDVNVSEKAEARIQKREEATVILNQNFKQKVLLSLAALLAGTVALMLAVAFLEWRSRRIDSVDQVVSELGLRVIGTIPAFPTKQALKSGAAATSQNWRFVLNESVNSARTMLLHTAKTQNMQVLMVTSAMQGEGKTSLASQLATSMASAGLRTLILDCDLRNPSMHKLFDAPLTPGCAEVLCQEIDVSDAVQPTTVPNLWLIPAGQCSNRVISALAQGHPLETLFNRLRGQFDFVVVDSCPVLPVADSLLVGQHVDGVVISILQDVSQLPKVQLVSDRLTDLNIPVLGAVVNGIKPDIHAYGYNYVKQLPA